MLLERNYPGRNYPFSTMLEDTGLIHIVSIPTDILHNTSVQHIKCIVHKIVGSKIRFNIKRVSIKVSIFKKI